MNTLFRWMLAPALALTTTAALAEFHTYQIEEIFSNTTGTVQFIRMHESQGMSMEYLWAGNRLQSTSTHLGTTQTFVFPNNLPVGGMCNPYYGCATAMMSQMMSPVMPTAVSTANTRVLIATQGFADLHLITPDFVVPNGFLAVDGGTINYAGVDFLTYGALSTDGVTALMRDGSRVPNVAMNFAGQSASVMAAPAAVDLNQHGLTGSWYKQATSGQGVEVQVYPDHVAPGTGDVFVSWFTYDTAVGGAERQRWYTAQGQVVTGQPSASLTIYQNTGGNFNAPPATNGQAVGTATLSFDTCSSGQLMYSFNDGRMGTIPLTRLLQNVTCSSTAARPTNADFALSGNWYGGAATDGQGFTAEVNPNSGYVFVAWYTYAPSGAGAGAAGQRWYTAQATTFAPGSRSIPVTIYENTGGLFDAPTVPLPPAVPVGSGTLAFQSCSAATFMYTFTAGSSNGLSGTIALSRVGGVVPAGCTS
jgi:hypothetical protein